LSLTVESGEDLSGRDDVVMGEAEETECKFSNDTDIYSLLKTIIDNKNKKNIWKVATDLSRHGISSVGALKEAYKRGVSLSRLTLSLASDMQKSIEKLLNISGKFTHFVATADYRFPVKEMPVEGTIFIIVQYFLR
jgi:hypothetical protein